MMDISGLLSSDFKSQWDNDTIKVYGGYFRDGQINLIVSKNGGPLYIATINELQPTGEEG